MLSRTLFTLSCLVAANLAAKAQHVYSIRADSVRIYNVCDTAELILENKTQGVTGYLYNKGLGRTEFRKLQLKNIGGTRIAIIGQDTLDLGQMDGIGGIDTIYRLGDSIKYVKRGIATPMAIGAAPPTNGAGYIHNQINSTQTGQFHISGRGLTRGMFEVWKNGADTVSDGVILRNASRAYGANFQLTADAIPGIATWVATNGGWVKRMEVASNGTVSYGYMTVHGFSAERMSQRFNAIGFNRNVWNGSIYDSTKYAYQLVHVNNAALAEDFLGMSVYNGTGGEVNNAAWTVNNLGNVGINEKKAIDRLQLTNGEMYIKSLGNTNNAVHKGIKFGTDNDDGYSAIRAVRGATSNRIGLSFFTSNIAPAAEVMRLTEDGKLGIGITSPTKELHVKGNAWITGHVNTYILASGNSDSSLHIIGGGTYQGGQIGLFGGNRGGQLVFYTGTGTSQQPERMRITANGSFGLGTSNPQFPVHVSTLNTAGMAIQNTGTLSTTSGAYLRLYNSGMPSAAGQRLGSILYGANTTGATYNVGAQIDAVTEGAWTTGSQPTSLVFYNTPVNATGVTEKMRLTSSGNLTVSGTVTATTITQTSRRELKTNIHLYPHSALEVLRGATVRAFNFKTDLSRQHIGFIADEVPREMAVPDRSGVDQGNTVGLLVKAVQELEQKNKALEDKLSELETLIREIKDKR